MAELEVKDWLGQTIRVGSNVIWTGSSSNGSGATTYFGEVLKITPGRNALEIARVELNYQTHKQKWDAGSDDPAVYRLMTHCYQTLLELKQTDYKIQVEIVDSINTNYGRLWNKSKKKKATLNKQIPTVIS